MINEQNNMQPENSSNRKLTYTVQEISEILDVSVRTVYNLCNNTKDFKVKRIGRCVRIHKESFDKWFQNCDMAD